MRSWIAPGLIAFTLLMSGAPTASASGDIGQETSQVRFSAGPNSSTWFSLYVPEAGRVDLRIEVDSGFSMGVRLHGPNECETVDAGDPLMPFLFGTAAANGSCGNLRHDWYAVTVEVETGVAGGTIYAYGAQLIDWNA